MLWSFFCSCCILFFFFFFFFFLINSSCYCFSSVSTVYLYSLLVVYVSMFFFSFYLSIYLSIFLFLVSFFFIYNHFSLHHINLLLLFSSYPSSIYLKHYFTHILHIHLLSPPLYYFHHSLPSNPYIYPTFPSPPFVETSMRRVT